jgi:subtilisin family serine protease
MKLLSLLLLAFCLILVPPSSGQHDDGPEDGGTGDRSGRYVQGELIIRYKKTVSEHRKRRHLESMEVRAVRAVPRTDINVVQLPEGVTVEDALRRYQQDQEIEHAQPNWIYRLARVPADPLFSQLWGLYNTGQSVNGGSPGMYRADISMPEAWDIATGKGSVIVAVIDTGVDYNHPDLGANIWRDGNGNPGYDFVDNDNDPMDYSRHGTHIAGIIGAVGNNGIGITGVNWNVSLMPLRTFDGAEESTDERIIRAINYARDHGAKVINASWGEYSFSSVLKDAIESFGAVGGLFVTAAGNERNNNDEKGFYPASFTLENIVAVAATDQNDYLASFSNYGVASVHLAAPGTNTNATVPPRDEVLHNTFNFGFPGDWTTGGTNNTWGVRNGRLTDSATGYVRSTNSWAQPPNFSLANKSKCQVSFSVDYSIKTNDFLLLEVTRNGGATWSTLRTFMGSSSFFVEETLKAYENNASLSLRFRLSVQPTSTGNGWVRIDDFDVLCVGDHSGKYPLYTYLNGTSMATGHAAGVAALVRGQNPLLTGSQVRQLLVENVDPRSFPVLSGGRLNALRSVASASLPIPGNLTATAVASNRVELSWTSMNDGQHTGFLIERSLSPGGPYAEIGDTDSTMNAYSDVSAAATTLYYYRVRSRNNVANSLPSNEAGATTPEAPASRGGGGGCFIATAAYGSPLSAEVRILQKFRDRYLTTNPVGRKFVSFYYRYSPSAARYVEEHKGVRSLTRLALYPIIHFARQPVTALLVTAGFLLVLSAVIARRSRHH